MSTMKLQLTLEKWPMAVPFRISGHTFEAMDVLLVTLEQEGHIGRGEATGVYYRNDGVANMVGQIEALRPELELGMTRAQLQTRLAAGGARNAVDCALWDLDAKRAGRSASQIAGLVEPKPLVTTFTCGADSPEQMVQRALGYVGARAIKIKLVGDSDDAARVRAVREAVPGAWLGVDANQGFTLRSLEKLLPVLSEARVQLIEQPFPVGEEAWLDELDCPIPVAADESVQTAADVAALAGRFDLINIKLDKCGGLTEALAMVAAARDVELGMMVGNMMGTSLAMAPAFLIGQSCDVVDLDGPALLRDDRAISVQYVDGFIRCPRELWGHPDA